jgi:ribosomal protein L40E
MSRILRTLADELDDPYGTKPYQESPGVWICRRCAAEIDHRAPLCNRCERTAMIRRRQEQGQPVDMEMEEGLDDE